MKETLRSNSIDAYEQIEAKESLEDYAADLEARDATENEPKPQNHEEESNTESLNQDTVETTKNIIINAVIKGEFTQNVVETDSGTKGFMGFNAGDARVEAMFASDGTSPYLDQITFDLDGDEANKTGHSIGIKFDKNGEARVFTDGRPADISEVPAVQEFVTFISTELEREVEKAKEAEQAKTEKIIDEVVAEKQTAAEVDKDTTKINDEPKTSDEADIIQLDSSMLKKHGVKDQAVVDEIRERLDKVA